jgi:HEAT repeat protein
MRVLELLPTALSFRNEAVVIAAARAAATLLPQQVHEQAPDTTDIRKALADIASDSETAPTVRRYALDALIAAEDPQLDKVLIAMTRDSRLEQTTLLDYLREFMRERRLAI